MKYGNDWPKIFAGRTFATILLRIASETFVADTDSTMHLHMAMTVKATGVQCARIDTSLIVAGLVIRTFRVLSALWNWLWKVN